MQFASHRAPYSWGHDLAIFFQQWERLTSFIPPPGVPLAGCHPGLQLPPSDLPLSAYFRVFSFFFLLFFRFAVFYVALILVMPRLPTLPARNQAAEAVPMLHILIFLFLLSLQLEESSILPITIRGVASCTLFVRRITVEKINHPLAIALGGCCMCFN